eukprot:scaffold6138_cov105-Isochrysis_galbana.AAC.5
MAHHRPNASASHPPTRMPPPVLARCAWPPQLCGETRSRANAAPPPVAEALAGGTRPLRPSPSSRPPRRRSVGLMRTRRPLVREGRFRHPRLWSWVGWCGARASWPRWPEPELAALPAEAARRALGSEPRGPWPMPHPWASAQPMTTPYSAPSSLWSRCRVSRRCEPARHFHLC